MDDRGQHMTEVLRRLRMDLPHLAPALWDSVRGPADDDVREALRAAVEPMPLPDELDVFLRAHDGQSSGAGWWPTLDSGPPLSGQQIAEQVTWSRSDGEHSQWSVAWIPVTHEQWYQAVLDAVPERSGTVIDASWPDLPRAMAPSFAHAVDAVIDLGRAGLLPTADDDRAKRLEREAFLDDLWQEPWSASSLRQRAEIHPAS
ncbi:hypothetical protein [Frigoribacterium sp. CFBP 13707]|uniref:hypothetical protein n=1 Tax=Frigoribacterium sp. CFBP 13707 TaxID=2775313 RepID=UPI0017815C4C|nr:hypothetical protein [Frigoribacterium sp. CFBP 13707]MBD8729473.1 hypothetical protein [Frigoribacterium sp. CFBP 13707]